MTADGQRLELPPVVLDALRHVTEALTGGLGVVVAPLNSMLSTQEAADYLGVSRPTLVRILERGDLPMQKPGRHRFVRLSDLVAFQERQRIQTRQALDEMQRESEASGLYVALDGQPPLTHQ